MKIDIFNHIIPPKYYTEFDKLTSALKDMGTRHRIPTMNDLDARFRVMDEFGEYRQVFSLASPPVEAIAAPDVTPRLAAIANDGMADLVRQHPDRFAGFAAALPMNNPDAAVKELERASSQLGALGAQIYSNVNGKPLDLPEFQPLFDEFARLDLRVARVAKAELVEGSDKLLRLTLDLGGEQRTVFSGIRAAYRPEQLTDRLVVVIANLAPRKMRFGVSQGMVLCAGTDDDASALFLLAADSGAQPGMKVS